ncbi:MAG: flagellar hook-associated protein FlgK [Agathobacter sp.]|nr:flagellar hook-associated protein FlgK [Agathobacter sp.]
MANGFGSFYVGTSGLQSSQNALNVVANNLSNVDTKGYVRQQVIFSDKHYLKLKEVSTSTNMQQSGIGVSIGDVVHARDIFLDKAYRLENGRQSFYSNTYEVVTQVEDLLQELDGEELKNALQDLRTGFQQLAEAPADSVNQNLVIQQSQILLGRFSALYSDLQSYQYNLNNQVKQKINNINDIGDQIYQLNLYIQKVESAGIETAMTARDQRDVLLDELSSYVNITYSEDATGFVNVQVEGAEFVVDYGCNHLDLQKDKTTGFYTPYWSNLSDPDKDKYTYLYKNLLDISTENNTDVGSLKALLYQRGNGFGTYADLENDKAYAKIEDCTLMETEAEVDRLFHYIATSINDLLAPNISAGDALNLGTGTLTATDANGNTYVIDANTKILDTANCSVGADKALPPAELFTRRGVDRYTEVTGADGNTYYIYNEEDTTDTAKCYCITGCEINSELLREESKLPMMRQDGAVNYALADQLQDLWDASSMTIDPTDKAPCTFEEFYDKMIDKLGTDGNVYYSSSQTLDTTVSSLDNQRQQVSGVSSDEELTHMVKYQAAYNAASRYITVISQMTELIVTGLI